MACGVLCGVHEYDLTNCEEENECDDCGLCFGHCECNCPVWFFDEREDGVYQILERTKHGVVLPIERKVEAHE